jgi:hypothetical protein
VSELLNQLWEVHINKQLDQVPIILNGRSEGELFDLFEEIIHNNPFFYRSVISYIIDIIITDSDEFIELLSKLLEHTINDLAFSTILDPIKRTVSNNPEVALSIAAKTRKLGSRPGLSSGLIKSPLLGLNRIDQETIENLSSGDQQLEVESLVAIIGIINIEEEKEKMSRFVPHVFENAEEIHEENIDLLINCLIMTFLYYDKEIALKILEQELLHRGFPAIIAFIMQTRYRDDFPVYLYNMALLTMEKEGVNNELIDIPLSRIYKEEPNIVVEKLRDRLKPGARSSFLKGHLLHVVKSEGPEPVIKMIEEEIDKENKALQHFGEQYLNDLMKDYSDWIIWCAKCINDEKKEKIIINSLRTILTKQINYKSSDVRDETIILVKQIIRNKGIDFNRITKEISLSEPKEGVKNKEITLKALYALKFIENPRRSIDIEILRDNLNRYPSIRDAFGSRWIISNAKSSNPHLITYCYDHNFEYLELSQQYWDNVFRIIKENNLTIRKTKLRNIENAESILTEAEIIAKLAPYFKITIEPDIEVLRPKVIDLEIEYNNEKALIEIAVVKPSIEFEVAFGGIGLSGGKAKNVILSKFKGQFHSGNQDPLMPVFLILLLYPPQDFYELENAIYGQHLIRWLPNPETGDILEDGSVAADNSFYLEQNSDIITGIIGYIRDYEKENPLVGKIYKPPLPDGSRYSISKKFRLLLRNALFGKSEKSDWRSLIQIKGIDEDMALKLYSECIEDIDTLAMASDDEISDVNGFTFEQMKVFRGESLRIIGAHSTNSIRFLKGIDQETYDILTSMGIFLIRQLIDLSEIPKGVNPQIWDKIMEDGKALLN